MKVPMPGLLHTNSPIVKTPSQMDVAPYYKWTDWMDLRVGCVKEHLTVISQRLTFVREKVVRFVIPS